MQFTEPGVQDIALPQGIGNIERIKLKFSCDDGELCNDVDADIRGCIHGIPVILMRKYRMLNCLQDVYY